MRDRRMCSDSTVIGPQDASTNPRHAGASTRVADGIPRGEPVRNFVFVSRSMSEGGHDGIEMKGPEV